MIWLSFIFLSFFECHFQFFMIFFTAFMPLFQSYAIFIFHIFTGCHFFISGRILPPKNRFSILSPLDCPHRAYRNTASKTFQGIVCQLSPCRFSSHAAAPPPFMPALAFRSPPRRALVTPRLRHRSAADGDARQHAAATFTDAAINCRLLFRRRLFLPLFLRQYGLSAC